jgi:hypothetical protein
MLRENLFFREYLIFSEKSELIDFLREKGLALSLGLALCLSLGFRVGLDLGLALS